jgi:polyisoprenyl-teichoic acid--peptidoglycan teichoic acid transferase
LDNSDHLHARDTTTTAAGESPAVAAGELVRDATPPGPGTGAVAPRPKSPLVAAMLSFVFPGVGQLYLGRRTSALSFAVPALAVVAWGLLQLSNGLVYFALSMLDDGYALTVMVVAAGFTAWRLVAIAHPYFVTRPGRLGVRAGAVLAALVIATIAMGDVAFSNAYAVYNADREIAANDFHEADTSPDISPDASPVSSPTQYQPWITYGPEDGSPSPSAGPSTTPFVCEDYPVKLASVSGGAQGQPRAFAPVAALSLGPAPIVEPNMSPSDGIPLPTLDVSPSPSPSPWPSPSPSPSPSPTVTPTDVGTSSPSPTPSADVSPSPSASPSAAPTPDPNRVTVLLTGVDFLQGRRHALNDTIILVSIDLQTRDVVMVSVPRDTANFPFYWGGQAPVNFKINALANAISAGRFGSPDPPLVTLANEVGYLVGVKVDYYAEVDIAGFAKLIDAVGGIDLYNPALLEDPFTCTSVPAGNVHLDSTNALRYARSRETSSDYYRSSRQQRVLIALEKKMASPAMLPRLGSMIALVGQSVATNFPLNTARNYSSVAERLATISQCVLGPPYNYHPDMTITAGTWTSRLMLDRVANLSVKLFGTDSRYYGQPGVTPTACQSRF